MRHNSVNSGNTAVLRFDSKIGDHFAWHINGVYRQRDDVSIPGFAIDEEALELVEPEAAAGETHELENTKGYISNTDGDGQSYNVGGSFIGERGFIGLAINQIENEYGIPQGGHAHHHAETEPVPEEEVEEELIRLDMQQTRYDLKAGFDINGFFERFDAQIAHTDYEHEEVEVFGTQRESGTQFKNKGYESRFTLNQQKAGSLTGVRRLAPRSGAVRAS